MARPADDLLAAAVRRDPGGPLLTFYDDATGERTELSATTLANWVAKTANLLRDDLDVERGTRVCLLLPGHWQTAVLLLAVWSAGAVPVTDPAGAPVVVADEPRLATAQRWRPREVLGLSLAPLNAPLADPPAGVVDYAAEVLSAGDVFVAAPGGAGMPAAAALDRAAQLGVTDADRVLVADSAGVADATDWLLAPLAAGASLVLCRNTDPAALRRRAAAERVTATLGTTVDGIRRLDG
ncbi:MAG: TIGR03089 family protein [Actinobacteria bacterium]|nr:TIGR03089 family protein [Actinomycetota bacterium]